MAWTLLAFVQAAHSETTPGPTGGAWKSLELSPQLPVTNVVAATFIPLGATWTYLDDGSSLSSSWRTRTFDDSAWASGPARLGYGGDGERTTVNYGPNASAKYITTYFRHRFFVENPERYGPLTIRVTGDDGVVVHLNGPEIFRSNLPSGTLTHTTPASSALSRPQELILYQTNIPATFLLAGTNVLTAEVHQSSGSSSDLGFDLQLLAETRVPPGPIPLSVSRDGTDQISLRWPAQGVGYQPQSAPALAGPPAWTNVLALPGVKGGWRWTALPLSNRTEFYTLGVDAVDASTMTGKLVFGYQGWFLCPQDSAPPDRWVHWFRRSTPVATNATIDFWPDTAEMDEDELFQTDMTLPGGEPARLYSSYTPKTVLRHFRWMRDYGVDGVMLQRFSSELRDPAFFAARNQLAMNVRAGAETYGRVFAMMYDISGNPAASVVSDLINDWIFLTDTLRLTNSTRYLRHNGRPVVAVWGFGFTDRPGTPAEAQAVIDFFKGAGLTVMGGVPTNWRTLSGDSQTDPAWAAVYRSFDIISPWSVGRYSSDSGANSFRSTRIEPDLAEVRAVGREYLPVIWPGFSWYNLNDGPVNQIPRRGGRFWWRQFYNTLAAGCVMVYGAMYDEVDEGTAMYKLAPTAAELPVQGTFVPLNIDGEALPSDWYLRVAGEASRVLRGERPLTSTLPITPPP